MVIIVEGADGSGKTTLVEKLEAQTGYPVMHGIRPRHDEDWFGAYVRAIGTYGRTGLILDRCWLSDYAYRSAMGDGKMSPDAIYEALDWVVKANGGGMVIYCVAKPKVAWTRAKQRGEEYVKTFEQFIAIHEGYENLFKDYSSFPVVRNVTG